MGIASLLSSGLPERHRHRLGRSRRIVLRGPFLLVWLGALVFVPLGAPAQRYRQAPMFEGKMIPDPPSQGQPWTAPATKLPRFLVTATELLFEQGVADPRGCEYRQVEYGDGVIKQDRGFVLPERADIAGRFVVCWDGLVYPALTVGAPADLDRDMNDLAAEFKKSRESRKGASGATGVLSGIPPTRDPVTRVPRMSIRVRRSSFACCSGSAAPTWRRLSSPRQRPGPRRRSVSTSPSTASAT